MSLKWAIKIGIVFGLGVLLWLPLSLMQGLIAERQSIGRGVVQDIARDSIDAQHLLGPVLIVPYKRRFTTTSFEYRDGKPVSVPREQVSEGKLAFLPEQLKIAGELKPEERHRGIHTALVYDTDLAVAGRFLLPADFGVGEAKDEYEFGEAALLFGVSDPRGIGGSPKLVWSGGDIAFAPGAKAPGFSAGITAPVGRLDRAGGAHAFGFRLPLKGLERIDLVPTGKESVVTLRSSWPSPSFYGRSLPTQTVADDGFAAEWRSGLLSTNVVELYDACLNGGQGSNAGCRDLWTLAQGVGLFRPADIYQQLDRAVKYGFLFIGLTFIGFFLYEVLRRLAIHPVQYGLVGVALAVFFLLLLSLSEHVDFALAYLAAALACVALIGFYVAHVLKSLAHAGLFTALLAGLYAMLYVLLSLEEQSLLVGSVGLFAFIAVVMIGTRKVDWYALEPRRPPQPAS